MTANLPIACPRIGHHDMPLAFDIVNAYRLLMYVDVCYSDRIITVLRAGFAKDIWEFPYISLMI